MFEAEIIKPHGAGFCIWGLILVILIFSCVFMFVFVCFMLCSCFVTDLFKLFHDFQDFHDFLVCSLFGPAFPGFLDLGILVFMLIFHDFS